AVLCWARYGWKRTVLLGAVVGPVVFVLFGGRQLRIDVDSTDDTGQERIQKWADGLSYFREEPLLGIGAFNFKEEMGLQAHNSFVSAYVETGLLGGSLFAGAFYFALWPLARLRRSGAPIADPRLRRLAPYVIAVVAAYAIGIFSLSRNYI